MGEDHSRPTNMVPALRKSPVELPDMPVRRDPDISQVIVRSQIHALLHGERAAVAVDFEAQAPAVELAFGSILHIARP